MFIDSFQNPRIFTKDVVAHKNWLDTLKESELLVKEDTLMLRKARGGLFLKERHLPMEVLGRLYSQYCSVVNKLYKCYAENEQLQKLPYMLDLARTFSQRMFELREEMVDYIVSDYLYIDSALIQKHKTPFDVEILVPFHYPLELRSETIERYLQKVWKHKELSLDLGEGDDLKQLTESTSSISSIGEIPKTHSEMQIEIDYYATLIQRHERYRQFMILHNRKNLKLLSFLRSAKHPTVSVPDSIKMKASAVIKSVLRSFFLIKREHLKQYQRDVRLGIQPPRRDKTYVKPTDQLRIEMQEVLRRKKKTKKEYLGEFEKHKTRLVYMQEGRIQDDITEHIREWFYVWYKTALRLPPYPQPFEKGTIIVIREDFPDVIEYLEIEEAELAKTKGMSKEQIAKEKEEQKNAAKAAAEAEKERIKREMEALFKMRCNPKADPGHKVAESAVEEQLKLVLRNYNLPWRDFDKYEAPLLERDVVYGFMKYLMTEEIMSVLHQDLRLVVDEFMKLELKLLVKTLKQLYKRCGWTYPKEKKPPKPPKVPKIKVFELNDENKIKFRDLLEIGVMQKYDNHHITDILGDFNLHAYEFNVKDPDAIFPSPEMGDVRNRLASSCVFGAIPSSGAPRRRSVLLVGPPKCGKTFMAKCVCGDLGAVMLDISPECFTSKIKKLKQAVQTVIAAAKVLQPTVIFIKDIERVFAKKLPPEDKRLKPAGLKKLLATIVKSIAPEDQIIFIGTDSSPWLAKPKNIMKLFEEVITVPLMKYNSMRLYIDEKLKSYPGVDRYLDVQPLAQCLKGYSLSLVENVINSVMNAKRIASLQCEPLRLEEILEQIIMSMQEPLTEEDYDSLYTQWVVANTSMGPKRRDYEEINKKRAEVFLKMKADEAKNKK